MKRTQLFGATVALALLAGDAGANCARREPTADIVFEWNQILQDTIPGAGGRHGPTLLRDDAHRDVRRGQRHRARVRAVPRPLARPGPRIARSRGGAGRARRARRPQSSRDWRSMTRRSSSSSARRLPSFERRGAAVGARVAKEVLAWRQNDGWIVTGLPPYFEPLLPGRWQPTPPNNPAAAFTHLQNAAPLAMLSATQFCRSRRRRSRASATRPTSTRCKPPRQVGQRDPHARADRRSRGLWAGVADDRHRDGDTISRDLEQYRARRRRSSDGCRSSRPRGCSRS